MINGGILEVLCYTIVLEPGIFSHISTYCTNECFGSLFNAFSLKCVGDTQKVIFTIVKSRHEVWWIKKNQCHLFHIFVKHESCIVRRDERLLLCYHVHVLQIINVSHWSPPVRHYNTIGHRFLSVFSHFIPSRWFSDQFPVLNISKLSDMESGLTVTQFKIRSQIPC